VKGRKILYGVCGIGHGHSYRQLPIIEWLSRENTIVIMAYANSLKLYTSYFEGNPNVTVLEVAVPYFAGNDRGLDFAATARYARDSGENYIVKNTLVMDAVNRLIGRPDLVISDYEPVSAQYSYAYDAPLITIDQQSKYLDGDFPDELHGQRYVDEVMRLRMFFPSARLRVACSFFNVACIKNDRSVVVVPPVLRTGIERIRQERNASTNTILVYLTAQKGFAQPLDEIMQILAHERDYVFHVFVPSFDGKSQEGSVGNVILHIQGAPEFDTLLSTCAGLITTAGHSLLAEAMYLGIPVYALPLPLYEQQMNAEVISTNGFGIRAAGIDTSPLDRFLSGIPDFAKNIAQDSTVLLRGNGFANIVQLLETLSNTGGSDDQGM
jgi:uncharacterized protein (TIGR00661 family)